MCGLAGLFRRDGGPVDERRLVAMRSEQQHRGPDAIGLRVAPAVGFAFNRLAIIDLREEANQPMGSEHGEAWVVFNGEIYNFPDLRQRLEERGHSFVTRSDTEVILKGYLEWGLDVLPRLNGMFALALWDARSQQLHLARDRVGKKPLHYFEGNGELVFASEVRALLKGLGSRPGVDPRALDRYFTYLCVPGEASIFEGVRKVPPASVLTCDRSGTSLRTYWRLTPSPRPAVRRSGVLETLEDLLQDAVRIRLISDVPLGALLSGGVDSSVVVALMARTGLPIRTFTVRVPGQGYDEAPFARRVAAHLGTEHTQYDVEPRAARVLPRLVWHYGEPFADSSAVPMDAVCATARRAVTVVLTGDGGDEGFAGYGVHRTAHIASIYRRLLPRPVRHGLASLARRLPGGWLGAGPLASARRLLEQSASGSLGDSFWPWPGLRSRDRSWLYTPRFLSRIEGSDPEDEFEDALKRATAGNDLDRLLQAMLETYLPDDLLVKADIASMAHSLEARSPLLDYRVLEYMAALPPSLKVRGWRTKYLLKRLAARLVPPEVIYRRKQGFAIPVAEWLRGPLRRPFEILVLGDRFAARDIVQPAAVRGMFERHLAGEDHSARLWSILWLELWHRMFVDGTLSRDDTLEDLK